MKSTKLTHDQNIEFFPFLMKMARQYQPLIQIDCSFVPNICYHKPSKKTMNLLGVEGCEGGNILLGVRADGAVNACSHFPEYFTDIYGLSDLWDHHPHFQEFRTRKVTDRHCRKCSYFKICRGGCPLFSLFIEESFNAPDPECPVLVEKRRKNSLITPRPGFFQ